MREFPKIKLRIETIIVVRATKNPINEAIKIIVYFVLVFFIF